jgi:proton-dependent oligopeptide transporter, POT family
MTLIVFGTGLLKPNMSTMVGDLYPQDSPKRDAGFSIFYMGINLGAFLAPLITGYLGEEINWHLGFAVAAIGMTFAVIQYVLGGRWLGNAGKQVPNPLEAAERRRILTRTGLLAAAAVVVALILAVAGWLTINVVVNTLCRSPPSWPRSSTPAR